MGARLIIFMAVVPLVWVLVHFFLGRRLLDGLQLHDRARRIGWAVIGLAAAVPPVIFIAMRRGGVPEPLQWFGYLLMGFSSIVLVLLLTVELGRGVGSLVARLRGRAAAAAEPDPSRRAFMGRAVNLGIVGGAGSVTGIGVVQAKMLPAIVEVDVPIAGLPPEAEGFRIVQISDVHVGPTIHGDYLSAVVDRVNEQQPDLVAVTGDLIDGYVDDLRPEVAALARLEGRYGNFFVTGNHEYYWNGPAWCAEVERLGLTVLNNRHQIIEHNGARLMIAGVTDYSAGRQVKDHASDPAAACADAAPHDAKILLAHQPRSIYAAAAAGYDLQISGHTHGGQYFPMNLLVYLAQPYVAGLARHDDTWIYVSRGTGYWGPPVRVGAPHEITVLCLVAA